ncbi:glutathione S-transferase family protein [Oscillatoria amoena NRMC-F 0135]|nr:glutathione S-transferase family protein [Geitlerinema splendidum]MDL5044872.1 glutathione S-transferase family protein [Oscillatoria amoena NRMC-F 0135]
MLKLYDFLPSGNGYKVRLLLTQLQIPFQRIEINILNQESRTPEFLQKNPNGRVPLIELESGEYLAESNAMLVYFSEGTPFYPRDRLLQAKVLQWMFFEQYSHEPYIATVRFWITELKKAQEYHAEILKRRPSGYAALGVMEQHLAQNTYFVDNRYTIADIALFAYTHVAEEGGYDLSGFPAIRNWIERIQAQPHHIPITDPCTGS